MCRKSISKLEDIRPRLEHIYENAVAAEKAGIEEAARMKHEQLNLKEEAMRLQKLKVEQSNFIERNNSTSELSVNNVSLAPSVLSMASSASSYSLSPHHVPSCNTLPNPVHLSQETNNTLKAMQERMGISSLNQSKTLNAADLSSVNSHPKYFSENGEALRPVHIPLCLMSKFLQLASQNTNNNLETCGVLAGKLNHNEFKITCLIIPKQVATSDTCAMINEEEIITAQDSLDVLSLGWIHVSAPILNLFVCLTQNLFIDSSHSKMFPQLS